MIRLFAVFWCLLAGASCALAHEVRPGFLAIDQTAATAYDVVFKVPQRQGSRLGLEVIFPPDCEAAKPKTTIRTDGAFIERGAIVCPDGLDGRRISIGGLAGTMTDVVVRLERLDGAVQADRLTAVATGFTVDSTPGWRDTARTYFLLGVDHILFGFDHLLFVLSLMLLIRTTRALVEAITAFTVAHSLTLAAASLGWVAVPQAPVEAVIALSIVFVAAEIVREDRGAGDLAIRAPWGIAFLFGLLHGFGFGGALMEIGLPRSDVPLALLTFNIGVEAGQLMFVFTVLALRFAVRSVTSMNGQWVRMATTYGIGSLAAFWFVERIVSFV